jgi:hypothetical protein
MHRPPPIQETTMTRLPHSLLAFALAAGAAGCADQTTGPDDDYDPETHTAEAISVADPSPGFDLPPLRRITTFWGCAGQAEGVFVDAVIRIHQLEVQALTTHDPFKQAVLFFQIDQLKHQAKMALHFALTECVANYPLIPAFFAVRNANGDLELRRFTVAAYHQYLVEKHLERS